MKSKALRLLVLSVLLFGVAAALHAWFASGASPRVLSRVKLASGGELQILQIRYSSGDADVHYYGRSPASRFRVWYALPELFHHILPAPNDGEMGWLSNESALSIWWILSDPAKHGLVQGMFNGATVTLDSGEVREAEAFFTDHFYGQVMLGRPPHHSTRLRFSVPLKNEVVTFTIDNPAYQKPDRASGENGK